MSNNLTNRQVLAIDIAERVSSALSLCGVFFIISTFMLTRRFRRPINRLIFFASFGNFFSNIGTLIARSAIARLNGRQSSPFCTFQGFLLQVFMPADAFFALCMAINVYLNIKHKFEALSLRKLELYYVTFCYLIPFIVGLVLACVQNSERGHIYGQAVIWCWIAPTWDVLRIATFYGPVWVSIICTFFLYAFTFRIILRLRRSVRRYRAEEKLRKSQTQHRYVISSGRPIASSNALPDSSIKVTTANSVNISQTRKTTVDPHTTTVTFTGPPAIRESAVIDGTYESFNYTRSTDSTASVDLDDASVKDDIEAEINAPPPVDTEKLGPPDNTYRGVKKARKTAKANKAALAYARCAMLFFIGLLITWLPSSTNRVYTYIHKDVNFPLSFLSALVLPAQGFWNLIIYTLTSWRSCVSLWEDIKKQYDRRRRMSTKTKEVRVKVPTCVRPRDIEESGC